MIRSQAQTEHRTVACHKSLSVTPCHCAVLTDDGPGFVVHMHLEDELLPEYGPSFKALDVEVTPETIERLHVKIKPSGVARWEVPESVISRWVPEKSHDFVNMASCSLARACMNCAQQGSSLSRSLGSSTTVCLCARVLALVSATVGGERLQDAARPDGTSLNNIAADQFEHWLKHCS